MTENETRAVKKLFFDMSGYYGQTIPDDVLRLYAADVADLPFMEVVKAMQALRRDPTNRRAPLPAQIRQRVKAEPTDEQQALDAVSRIVAAVSKVGPYETARARRFIGELGWLVVERDGGWEHVCSVLTDENLGTLRAQWRELAKALSARSRAGLTEPPRLDGPDGAVMDVRKLLPEMSI